MNIVVSCPCGTHYEFEIEPVAGKMPVLVQCPNCGADGTEAANAVIAQAGESVSTSIAEAVTTPPAPALKVPSLSSTYSEPGPTPAPMVQSQSSHRSEPIMSGTSLGLAGAVGGGFLSMMGWYLLIVSTGYEIGYAAWGVGVVTGLCARKLARFGSATLGYVAGACALFSILGGQYLAVNHQVQKYIDAGLMGAYDKRLEYAQEAVKVESDQDIRALLVKYSDPDDKIEAGQITDQQIRDFRQKEMPELQQFIQGRPARKEFETSLRRHVGSLINPFTIMKDSLSLFTLLWIFLGVGSAYKIGSQ